MPFQKGHPLYGKPFLKGHPDLVPLEARKKAGVKISQFQKGRKFSKITKVKMSLAKLKNPVKYWLGKKRPSISMRQMGNKNHRWKGGRWKTKAGYILIHCLNHPRAKIREKGHYVFEHILVAEKKLGRYLKPNEVVHHINNIKDDNCPKNLYVMKDRAHSLYEQNVRKTYHKWIHSEINYPFP